MEINYPWFEFAFTVLLLAATAIAYYLHVRHTKTTKGGLIRYILPAVSAVLVVPFILQQSSCVYPSCIIGAFTLALVAILSSFIGMYNYVHRAVFYISVVFVSVVMYLTSTPIYIIEVFSISALASLLYARHVHTHGPDRGLHGQQRSIELRRDVIQISAWAILLILFWILSTTVSIPAFRTFILYVVILLFIILELSEKSKGSRISKLFHGFEKPGMVYGNGAMVLSIGILLLIGFVNHIAPMLFFISVLMLSDAVATIAGLELKGPKLPYNKMKSVAGTIAFFVSASAMGYLLIGIYALPISIILAVVESLKLPVDDNIRLPVASILIYLPLASSPVWMPALLHL